VKVEVAVVELAE
jgi:DNA-binding protein